MSNQENISKETKKTRRKKSQRKSQQIKLAVIMIMVSVLVLSASTFAWYKMSKTADIQNMYFTADTLGNLSIAPVEKDGSVGTYSNSLDLGFTSTNKALLLPATTADGKGFFRPKYNDVGDTVIDLVSIEADGEEILDGNKVVFGEQDSNNNYPVANADYYVYKKEFYIKSGDVLDESKKYYLKLANGSMENSVFTSGTYIIDKDVSTNIGYDTESDSEGFTALRAIRVSFVFEDNTTTIFEPFADEKDDTGTAATVDEDNVSSIEINKYTSLKQDNAGIIDEHTLYTITEGKPVKVTMYVWLEGNDVDCENEIALDTIVGQIQFEAEEATTP